MPEARSNWSRTAIRAANLGLVGLLAVSCATKAPSKPTDTTEVSINRGVAARLINEGGPVFALPGEVVFPEYYAGVTEGLFVTAERTNGTQMANVTPARLNTDNSFELRVPKPTDVFFATAALTHEDALHRMRALVKPDTDKKITVDTASTLIAAKILLATKRHKMAELGAMHAQTTDLTDYMRQTVPRSELGKIRLDQSLQELSSDLDEIAARRPDLDYKLHAWQEVLYADGKATPAPAAFTPPPPPPIPLTGPPPK